jgi:hypothetical protein
MRDTMFALVHVFYGPSYSLDAACNRNFTPFFGRPVKDTLHLIGSDPTASPSSLSNRCKRRTTTYPAFVKACCCPRQILNHFQLRIHHCWGNGLNLPWPTVERQVFKSTPMFEIPPPLRPELICIGPPNLRLSLHQPDYVHRLRPLWHENR